MSSGRFRKFQQSMSAADIQAAAINAGPFLAYLTSLNFHLSERPVLLLASDKGKPILFFPEFEREKAESAKIPLKLISYGEDTATWVDVLSTAMQSLNFDPCPIAVPPESMRFLELDLLEKAAGCHQFISAGGLMRDLLMHKDDREVDSIKQAVAVAELAMEALLVESMKGKTEREIANRLVTKMLELGSEPDLPFHPIVASGPNSANPHAVPGSRVLQEGDVVVIDWGARVGGYVSDVTRTFQIGFLDEKFNQIAAIVQAANTAGRNAVQPDIQAFNVDKAAREVIAEAGFGEYFTHRAGHGIGLMAHEDPFISANSTTKLAPGMVFTVEPGIYLPGEGGVRIEDNVLVTREGAVTLTSLPRELRMVA